MTRPKLENCTIIRETQQQKYIDKMESALFRAAHFVTKQLHRVASQDLGWETLSSYRLQSWLTSFYMVLNNHLDISQSYHPDTAQCLESTRCHIKHLQSYRPEIDAFKFSFIPRTLVDWNQVLTETVHTESIKAFKLRLCTPRQ